jgi:hypothetical protein
MASTYSTNLALELIGTGDQAGTWGVTTNTNLGTLLEQAISGYVTQAVSTGTDTTITIPNGSTGVARNMYIELTGTGGTNTNLIVPANKKLYFIFNNASGAVTVKVSGQTGVSVPAGKKMILVSNGTDIVNGVNYIADFGTNSFTVTNLTATSATITNLIATTATVSDLSATVLRAASASITNLALTSLTISSLSITNVSVASATVSSNLTLSGGTANGVLYLNGSKVATSGSALTYDGTTLTTGRINVTNSGTGATFSSSGGSGMRVYGSSGTNQWDVYLNSTNLRLSDNTGGGQLYVDTGAYFGGNVGIGTSSPVARLDVFKTSSDTISRANAVGAFGDYVSLGAGLLLQQTLSSPYGFALQAANAANSVQFPLLLNPSGGNVGIGTASPAEKLTVAGNIKLGTSGTSYLYGPATNGRSFIANSDATAYMGIYGSAYGSGLDSIISFVAGTTNTMTFNASGNLGLGVTPSLWNSDYKALNIGSKGIVYGRVGSQETAIGANWYRTTASAFVYASNGFATFYAQDSGNHTWHIAPNNTSGAGATASFTQAMTLDASGNLGVGTSSPSSYAKLAVVGTSTGALLSVRDEGTPTGNTFVVSSNANGTAILVNSAGNVLVGKTISVGGATPSTSGSGVTFPATQSASSNANTLDDYEEGTWTPSVSAGAISGTGITYSGSYTKIGRMVLHQLTINSTASDLVVGSYVTYSGLPFTVATTGSGSITTEDVDFNARNGFSQVGGSTMTLGPCGSATGTTTIYATVVGYV